MSKYGDDWFNATYDRGWPDLSALTWHWSDDQRTLTVRHKDGKRIGIRLPDAIVAAVNANPQAGRRHDAVLDHLSQAAEVLHDCGETEFAKSVEQIRHAIFSADV